MMPETCECVCHWSAIQLTCQCKDCDGEKRYRQATEHDLDRLRWRLKRQRRELKRLNAAILSWKRVVELQVARESTLQRRQVVARESMLQRFVRNLLTKKAE